MSIINKETGISVGISCIIFSAVFSLGILWNKVGNNGLRITTVEAKVEEIPNRNEFDSLKDYFNQRFSSIDASLNTLLKKN